MKPYQEEIRAIAEHREVRYLLHFTQSANLPGIVNHGILPRHRLAGPEYLAYASDHSRLDENDAAVSVSVSRVNEVMFASKRNKSGHPDWVVLVLSADILWTHDCLFCWRNAAKKEIKSHRGWRGGPWAFAEMFTGSDEERRGLGWCCPTDPEAEVQVLGSIASKYIRGAVVDRPGLVGPVQTILDVLLEGPRPVVVDVF